MHARVYGHARAYACSSLFRFSFLREKFPMRREEHECASLLSRVCPFVVCVYRVVFCDECTECCFSDVLTSRQSSRAPQSLRVELTA